MSAYGRQQFLRPLRKRLSRLQLEVRQEKIERRIDEKLAAKVARRIAARRKHEEVKP